MVSINVKVERTKEISSAKVSFIRLQTLSASEKWLGT